MTEKVFNIIFRCLCLLPINSKKVLFTDYYGSRYGCNPKYISKVLSKYKDIDIVWAFVNQSEHSEYTEGRSVKWGSFRFLYELATSKVFITNFRMPLWYHRRRGQCFIQTWHTPMNIKAIEKDTESTLTPHYLKMAKSESKNISLLLSTAKYATQIFKRAFWYDGDIFEIGAPRCDLLVNQPEDLKNRIKDKLGLDRTKKVVLYAPTFRKGHSLDCYDVDFDQLIAGSESEWIVLTRLHPHLQNFAENLFGRYPFVKDVTNYDDLQEILLITDVLISDYSGLIFDYALTRRPCLLYTPDLEEYCSKDRKLYFEIDKLPFPICRDNAELARSFKEFDKKKYATDLELFLRSIGMIANGDASEVVAQRIVEMTNT